MSKKLLGILLGLVATLAPMLVWVLLGVFADYALYLVGLAMSLVFCVVYRAVNKEDKSKLAFIISLPLGIICVFLSQLIVLLILGAPIGATVGDYLADPIIGPNIIRAVLVSAGFAVGGSFLYLLMQKEALKKQQAASMQPAINGVDVVTPTSTTPTETSNKIDRLAELNNLKQKGLISNEEFELTKAEILKDE